jgi:hypothetical protein
MKLLDLGVFKENAEFVERGIQMEFEVWKHDSTIVVDDFKEA